ncbi:tetratricopeptide tpr 1 repeat-containing protein [Hydrogenovibrio crunogenus]|uniref:Tetratricopeptide tpr 1 repeat-containing protein n=1 Tax=Hydrogenovibrio crunogenus TaxID=39765 RepID=A0A4P7NWX0_9GAMM|nr:hypothetical protein [Hydrogenovibrio crunogenus]QBZ82177.1 tetratricopeptide tpr 1 repeat-containing protein [Hydrogenovibrio crunogenus]
MMNENIKDAFTKNRAEYYPDDVYGLFAIPPFVKNYNFINTNQSWRIVGARGTGKTMFLKSLCHATVFSPKKNDISLESIKNIGIYWRPDTQLCSLITDNWLGSQWKMAFLHYLTLILLEEIYYSLKSIQKSKLELDGKELLKIELDPVLSECFEQTIKCISDLKDFCNQQKLKLSFWLNNYNSVEQPKFLSPFPLIPTIVDDISRQVSELYEMSYMVYVDEYENLAAGQQALINDFIKHSRPRLRFSFAMKKYADICWETSGTEKISETHDFRTIDLDGETSSEEFKLMAAEFVVYRLRHVGAIDSDPDYDNPEILTEEKQLSLRLDDYRVQKFVDIASKIFPSCSSSDVAAEIINDKTLRNKVLSIIKLGLKSSGIQGNAIKPQDFIIDSQPEASIVSAAILNRKKQDPQQVLNDLIEWAGGNKENNQFKGWIENNIFGVIFMIYKSFPKRTCPLYAGFDRFCILSRKNMRHFQELCHEALIESLSESGTKFSSIPINIQAHAARRVSEKNLIEVVPSLGQHGESLRNFVARLGMIFSVAAKRYSQSEPEINHFSINISSGSSLPIELQDLIRSAKVWNVLFEENKTKSKSDDIADKDYILNPIFAPFYGISYRKIRKIDFNENEVNVLFLGGEEEFNNIYKRYLSRWKNAEVEVEVEVGKVISHQDQIDF